MIGTGIGAIWEYLKANYGNIASVIGLVITYFVYRNVRNLRNNYTFVGRSDEFIDRLRKHATELTGCLNDFSDSHRAVASQMLLIRATLETLEKVSGNPQKKSVQRLLRRIRKYSIESNLPWTNAYTGEKGLREIHDNLLYITQTVVDAKEDLKYG